MADKFNSPGDYRIEVSGWGLDGGFFVEKTDLHWSPSGVKQLALHRTLPAEAMIFVRLLASESMDGSVPVAYQVNSIQPMDCSGRCEMQIQQVHPRSKAPSSKAPNTGASASYIPEDSFTACEPRDSSIQLEPEEILQ
jgi:hypothetical protein